jgi:hypothetical protein
MSVPIIRDETAATFEYIARHYADAWNAHDVAAIMSWHADDTRYRLHGEKQSYDGRDAVAEKFARQLKAAPDIRFALKSLFGGSDHFVFEATITYTGKSGETVQADGIDLITIRDGLIVTKDSYMVGS